MKRCFRKSIQRVSCLASILFLSYWCAAPAAISMPATAEHTPISASTSALTDDSRKDHLSDKEVATLSSLKRIDEYPLYTMQYHGTYDQRRASNLENGSLTMRDLPIQEHAATVPAWACSLFAALGDPDKMLFGRNFDWDYSPAVLLFADPPEGFASVSMVDIAYLGFGGARAARLTDLPLIERKALLNAPFLPFDGMNEKGLAVGMAAVPSGNMVPDPARKTVGALMVIRKILDQASDVDEAVDILQSYNIDMSGGPPLHYMIAALSGDSVLVEFYHGKMVVIPNERGWQMATNFLRASVADSAAGICPRYDLLNARLTETEGRLSVQGALDLLSDVSQGKTQWSVIYGISSREIEVIMGRKYDNVHTFSLSIAGD